MIFIAAFCAHGRNMRILANFSAAFIDVFEDAIYNKNVVIMIFQPVPTVQALLLLPKNFIEERRNSGPLLCKYMKR
jgi:hypothetical protein